MASDRHGQFLVGIAVLTVGVFLFSAALSPPDPIILFAIAAVLFPLVVVVSYVLAYRRGFEWV